MCRTTRLLTPSLRRDSSLEQENDFNPGSACAGSLESFCEDCCPSTNLDQTAVLPMDPRVDKVVLRKIWLYVPLSGMEEGADDRYSICEEVHGGA